MAQKIELQFDVEGNDLFADLRRLRDEMVAVGVANEQVQKEIQGDLKKSTESTRTFTQAMDATGEVIAEVGAQARTGGVAAIGKGLEDGARKAEKLAGEISDVRVESAAAARTVTQIGRAQDQVAGKVKLTAQQYAIIREELQRAGLSADEWEQSIAEAVEELAGAVEVVQELAPAMEPTLDAMDGLQRQLRAAKKEAGELAAQFGIDSEQAIEAQRRVGDLTDQVGDLKARFDAFNPDKKFQAVQQLAFSLQGGLFAIQSISQLIAGDNEALQRILGTMQTLIFATTGLQSLWGGLGDSLKTLRAVLTTTTAATTAQAEASAVAGAAATGAGAAAGASTTGWAAATAAVKAFTVALITNPIFLVVAAITTLTVAMIALSDGGDKAKKSFDDLFDTLEKFRRIGDRTIDLDKQLKDLDIARKRILASEGDFALARQLVEEAANAEINAIQRKAAARRQDAEDLQRTLDTLQAAGKLDAEEVAERQQRINAIIEETEEVYGQTLLVRRAAENELAQINRDALKEAEANAKARKALVEETILAERELTQRLLQEARRAEGERDPFRRVENERLAAQEEITELERGFARKLAAIELQKRIGRRAFEELTQIEREARLDALIDEQGIRLPAQQQEQINALRLLVEQAYGEQIEEVYRAQARARAEIIGESLERERRLFELGLLDKLAELRKAGLSEAEVLEFQTTQREEFARKQTETLIDADLRLAQARIRARERGAEAEKAFLRRQQLDLLAVEIAANEERLRVIQDDATAEGELRRAEITAVLADLRRARAEILGTPLNLNLLDLLGLTEREQAAVRQALGSILASVQQTLSAINQARSAEVQAAISASDALISDAQRRRSELQSQLQAELEDRKAGLANNVDAVRAAIAEQERVEAAALVRKKQLQEEQVRLARQQVIVDSIVQFSSMVTAVAQVFKAESWKGVVGVVGSISSLAAMVASFIALKARLRAASAPQGFKEGTKSVRRGPGERPGIDTVHAMLTEGEAVVPVAKARKHRRLVEAIIDDDFSRVSHVDLSPLLRGTGVRLNEAAVRRTVRLSQSAGGTVPPVATERAFARLERRVEELTEEVRRFRSQEAAREQIQDTGGKVVIRRGNEIHTIRKAKP